MRGTTVNQVRLTDAGRQISAAAKAVPVLIGVSFLMIALLAAVGALAQEPEKLLPLEKEIQLFNGKDLRGWVYYSDNDEVPVEKVWSVDQGVLKATGKPAGYLQSKYWYRDYQLELEWRWPGEKGGNSGVLVHTSTPLVFYGWPKSLEVQLYAGHAGDFWVICEGVDITVDDMDARRPKPKEGDQHSHRRISRLGNDLEKPVGQWNKLKIVCDGDQIRVFVNGTLANYGTHCTVTQGAIALQSEGTAVEFRNIKLKPLDP